MNKKFAIGCSAIAVLFILILIAVFFGFYISIRNNMVAKDVKVSESWAQVQNVYQRRLDLIPNIAEAAKAYLKLEKDIFEEIAAARSGIQSAQTPSELESAASDANALIRDIKVVVEDTPELKASETVRDLMNQLEGAENRITVERQRFNESVRDYNVYIKSWPNSIIAGRLGFEEKEFFAAKEGAETAPEIDMSIE
ncbi:MAG TPA: LemA family protein [Actinobacteria bacterium]|nr:LemA family protein [Actinomycetota bacterium]